MLPSSRYSRRISTLCDQLHHLSTAPENSMGQILCKRRASQFQLIGRKGLPQPRYKEVGHTNIDFSTNPAFYSVANQIGRCSIIWLGLDMHVTHTSTACMGNTNHNNIGLGCSYCKISVVCYKVHCLLTYSYSSSSNKKYQDLHSTYADIIPSTKYS